MVTIDKELIFRLKRFILFMNVLIVSFCVPFNFCLEPVQTSTVKQSLCYLLLV